MSTWIVRAQYPTGDVVEEFADQEEAIAARERHLEQGFPVSVATLGPAPGAVVQTRCSFCGKERNEALRLIVGPPDAGVAICDECVRLCYGLIESKAHERDLEGSP